MNTIYKWAIPINDIVKIETFKCAKVLYVGLDPNRIPCVWMEVEPNQVKEERTFYVVGTGNPIPERAVKYVGTFIQGPFVWHVYTE